jgi:hypothetical protein
MGKLRKWVVRIVVGLMAGVVVAVLGQWVIDLLQEHAFYDHPSKKVDAVIAFTQTMPFAWMGGGIVGLALGVLLDTILMRAERRTAVNRLTLAPAVVVTEPTDTRAALVAPAWMPQARATAKFLSDHVQGFEALAVELEGDASKARITEIQKRCEGLYANVKNHLTANRVRLNNANFLLDFLSVHPIETFPNPGGWSEDRYGPWRKARRSARRLREFVGTLGVPTDLPAADALRASVIAGLRSAEDEQVRKRLASLTKDEEHFLGLFALDELPMRPEKQETWLLHAVYNAGERLCFEKILTRTDTEGGKWRFSLTDATERVWNGNGLRKPSKYIDIDGHAVCGTGASGSGAPGGFSR